jgi:hypothetical protein
VSADNVFGFLVLVGVPAFLIAVRMVTKRFLDPDPRDVRDDERVGAGR